MSQASTSSQVAGSVTGAAISSIMPWVAGGVAVIAGFWWLRREVIPDLSGVKDAGQTAVDAYTEPFKKIAAKKEAEAKKAAEKAAEREKKKEDLEKAVEEYNKQLEEGIEDLEDDEGGTEFQSIKWNQTKTYSLRKKWMMAKGGKHPGQQLFAQAWNNARKRGTALEQYIDDIDAGRKAAGRMNLDKKVNVSAYGFNDPFLLVKGLKSGGSGHWVR